MPLNFSRVTVSVTNKYIAGNMWIVEESSSECGRMKIVLKQSCVKSKFATDSNRERTIPRTFDCLYVYIQLSHGIRQSRSGVTAVTQ